MLPILCPLKKRKGEDSHLRPLRRILNTTPERRYDGQCAALNLKKTTLNLKVEQLNYDQVNSVIDDQLREQLADFRLKKSTKKVNDLLEKLETPDKDSLLTFGWWKELLRDFLNKQYPEEYAAYEKALKELKIL